MIQADGPGCPMAHGGRVDDSFQPVAPLRAVTSTTPVADWGVARSAAFNLGAFSGQDMAVCVYTSPVRPAVVAFDPDDGSVLWMSPPDDLQVEGRQIRAGILMAKVRVDGGRLEGRVFAAGAEEVVAYSGDGARLWRRVLADLVPSGADPGPPIALSFDDAGELVTATPNGWVLKLDPRDGALLDAYAMDTSVVVAGRVHRGRFVTFKSPAVIGDVMYLLVEFEPAGPSPLPSPACPVHLVRIHLSDPALGGRIRPLQDVVGPGDRPRDRALVGYAAARGSPSATQHDGGRVTVFANAAAVTPWSSRPVMVAVEDDGAGLDIRWRVPLGPGETIRSAPAFHRASGTLLVSTNGPIHVLRVSDRGAGEVDDMASIGGAAVAGPLGLGGLPARFGSPLALAYDELTDELVVYTNLRVGAGGGYGFLTCFALPARGPAISRPLWREPLALTAGGDPAPGPGTFGQAALFRYGRNGGAATGLIVNTVCSGTYIMR